MRHSTRILAAGIALTGLLGLSACGSGNDKDAAAPTTTKAPSTTAAGAGKDCSATPGKTVTVEIGTFKFDPTPVQVAVCDSVVWKNVHDQAHTSTGSGDKSWNTGNIAPGASSKPILFDASGELTYMCALHPFMKGVVEVS